MGGRGVEWWVDRGGGVIGEERGGGWIGGRGGVIGGERSGGWVRGGEGGGVIRGGGSNM